MDIPPVDVGSYDNTVASAKCFVESRVKKSNVSRSPFEVSELVLVYWLWVAIQVWLGRGL
jgi:hypothetical protein